MLRRPQHLVRRQISGRVFSEPVTILRPQGSRNEFGEYNEIDTRMETLCATAPASGVSQEAVLRELTEGGVQLDSIRVFWTVEDLNPVIEGYDSGDKLIYLGERYRVHLTQRWGGFSETIGKREEAQQRVTT